MGLRYASLLCKFLRLSFECFILPSFDKSKYRMLIIALLFPAFCLFLPSLTSQIRIDGGWGARGGWGVINDWASAGEGSFEREGFMIKSVMKSVHKSLISKHLSNYRVRDIKLEREFEYFSPDSGGDEWRRQVKLIGRFLDTIWITFNPIMSRLMEVDEWFRRGLSLMVWKCSNWASWTHRLMSYVIELNARLLMFDCLME